MVEGPPSIEHPLWAIRLADATARYTLPLVAVRAVSAVTTLVKEGV